MFRIWRGVDVFNKIWSNDTFAPVLRTTASPRAAGPLTESCWREVKKNLFFELLSTKSRSILIRRTSEKSTSSTSIVRRPSLMRSEEHTSELQSLMRISYAVFCLNKQKK